MTSKDKVCEIEKRSYVDLFPFRVCLALVAPLVLLDHVGPLEMLVVLVSLAQLVSG